MKQHAALLIFLMLVAFPGCKKEEIKETVTDIDGNVYNTVTIGSQVWMVENLKVTRYRNGDPIMKITDQTAWLNSTIGAYCNYYNIDSNSETYGHLYNWLAAGDARKIAPVGWHIPTYEEWFALQYFLGDYTVAGGKMKKAGTEYWMSPNAGTDNSSGLNGMPGGMRTNSAPGYFSGLRYFGFWWSATEESTNPLYAHYRSLRHDSPVAGWGSTFKNEGLSVRCIKD
ncbi:MAG: fibrobacter succinogenes major paralogous domain-containing protein [Chitinophagaceae bacterium]